MLLVRNRPGFWLPLSILAAGLLLVACGSDRNAVGTATASAKPNIVLILLDDMGYNDLGANGNPAVTTPNLDKLASEGVRFTRHYTDSTCTATRIGIMTGMSPAKQGFRPDNLGLSPELLTLPEMLQEAGYSTHHIGKWHIGFASQLAWPRAQGFDSFFGFLNQFLLKDPHQAGAWTLAKPTYHNPWLQQDNQAPAQYLGHLSEALTQRAVDFINSRSPNDQPWFLNFWTYAPHNPIQPMAEFAERYPDDPAGRYRALIEQLDATVGRVMDALDARGLVDNTLVLVASDNGGTNSAIDNNAPFFGTKARFYEGGVRTPMIMRWPGKLPAGQVHPAIVSYLDYFPTLAKAAGGKPGTQLSGDDLVGLVQHPERRRPALYWETGNSKQRSWSVLSSDGRWRLTQDFVGAPQLFDLVKQPAGDQDLAADYPDLVDTLQSNYRHWHLQQHAIELQFQPLGSQGRGKLSGASLARVPGYAGHSFAIGLTPEVTDSDAEQVIAMQDKQWKLSQFGRRLKLSIQGHELEAPAPPPGRCSSLIVASHFQFGFAYPKSRWAYIEIFIDGQQVAKLESKELRLPSDDFLQPTYIGQAPDGSHPFRGVLGKPVMLNEKLVPGEGMDANVSNGISTIEEDLCAN